MKFRTKKAANPYDEVLESLLNAWRDSRDALMEAVELVIIKQSVLPLYPDGADKEMAEREVRSAQKLMVSAIGQVDARRREVYDWWARHCDQLDASVHSLATSHDIVETAYRNRRC